MNNYLNFKNGIFALIFLLLQTAEAWSGEMKTGPRLNLSFKQCEYLESNLDIAVDLSGNEEVEIKIGENIPYIKDENNGVGVLSEIAFHGILLKITPGAIKEEDLNLIVTAEVSKIKKHGMHLQNEIASSGLLLDARNQNILLKKNILFDLKNENCNIGFLYTV